MSLEQYKNISDIDNTIKQQRGVRYYELENNQLPAINFYSNFGNSVYDVLEMHIYDDLTNNYIISNQNIKTYLISDLSPTFENKPTIILNTQQDLIDTELQNGRYKIVYNFMRNILGGFNSVAEYLYIDQISTDGTELRVMPVDPNNTNFVNQIIEFASVDNNSYTYWPDVVMNFSKNKIIPIINWQLDIETTPNYPYSLLLKLYEPLPGTIKEKDLFWISTEVSSPLIDRVFLDLPTTIITDSLNYLRGANFNLDLNQKVGYETDYKSWNEVLGTNQQSTQELLNSYLNDITGSIKGIELNIDYSDYNNFINFSSATERLNNFKYKLQLIESYNSRIYDIQSMVSGSQTGSVAILSVSQSLDKINKIKSTFDGFEKYMYYESGSNYVSSNGLVLSRTWPKSTATKPYILYPVSSSIAETWFENQLDAAQQYDRNNSKCLINLIPMHIRNEQNPDGSFTNQSYELYVNMIAHYYDILWQYIDNLTESYNKEQKLKQGIAKDLIYHFVESFGWDLDDGLKINDLWEYSLGIDSSGNYITGSNGLEYITPENRQKEIWKRIYNNLPNLLKQKGTARGIKALISCYGVPSTILRIKEYGGATYNDSEYVIDKYTYRLNFTGKEYIDSISRSPEDYIFPQTIQIRIKPDIPGTEGELSTIITDGDDAFAIKLVHSHSILGNINVYATPSNLVISSSLLPLYDGNMWNIMLTSNTGSNDTILYVKSFHDERFTHQSITSGSLNFAGQSGFIIGNNYSGSMQEFRSWFSVLDEYAFDAYCKNADAYFTNSPTSSYGDLYIRLQMINPIDHTITSSIPLTRFDMFGSKKYITSYAETQDFETTSSYESFVETRHIKTPKYWGNKINSNKIRFEDGTKIGNLNAIKKVEVYDDTKTFDSPKLGINFSPSDIINEDIFAQMGDFVLDNYIGNPADQFNQTYIDLVKLKEFYFKKYPDANNIYNFIRYINIYDLSLFKQIKKLLPERNNAIVGLAIEPHILERSKYQWRPLTLSTHSWSDTIEYNEILNINASNIALNVINSESLYLSNINASNLSALTQSYNLIIGDVTSSYYNILSVSESLINYDISSEYKTQLSDIINLQTLYSSSGGFGLYISQSRENLSITQKIKLNEFKYTYEHYVDATNKDNCIPYKIMAGTFFVTNQSTTAPTASIVKSVRDISKIYLNSSDIFGDNSKMFLSYLSPPTDSSIKRYLYINKIIDDSVGYANYSSDAILYEINSTITPINSSAYMAYSCSVVDSMKLTISMSGNYSNEFFGGDQCIFADLNYSSSNNIYVVSQSYYDASNTVIRFNSNEEIPNQTKYIINKTLLPGRNYTSQYISPLTYSPFIVEIPVVYSSQYGNDFGIISGTKYKFIFYSEKTIITPIYRNYYDEKKYKGFLNTSKTTLDGKEPVEIFKISTAGSVKVKNLLDNQIDGLDVV